MYFLKPESLVVVNFIFSILQSKSFTLMQPTCYCF